jgi:hypothetical protein
MQELQNLTESQYKELTSFLRVVLKDAQSTTPKKWLTRKEAGELAGVSLRTIDDRVSKGLYTISKGSGRTCKVYILHADVERLIDRNRHVRTPYKPHSKPPVSQNS